MTWDPQQYSRFADHRSRPFFDLVGQVRAIEPRTVLDVGCGPGTLTATLAERWPGADVRGVDASAEMVAAAPPGISVGLQRAEDVDATGVDVLVTNATLQWVPTHPVLLERWAGQLPAGGWLALQVPANFTAPSHVIMRELAEGPAWADRLGGVLRHDDAVRSPDAYLDLLVGAGLRAEVWQTTYSHVLQGPDPVLEWVRGTGLRPVLAALDPEESALFTEAYAARLREAYPARPYGTVLGFTRTFAVAHKPG